MKLIQKKIIFVCLGLVIFIGVVSYLSFQKRATSVSWDSVLGASQTSQTSGISPKASAATSQAATKPSSSSSQPDSSNQSAQHKNILVDIKGAVTHPGVYPLQDNSRRVMDVIQLAGGLTKEADSNRLNLAQHVQDEMVIYVPKKGEPDSSLTQPAPVLSPGNSSTPSPSSTGTRTTAKVHLNTAKESDLETLPGIGPSKAKAIIDYRTKTGGFASLDDLLNVTGIGAKTLEKLKEQLQLN